MLDNEPDPTKSRAQAQARHFLVGEKTTSLHDAKTTSKNTTRLLSSQTSTTLGASRNWCDRGYPKKKGN